MISIKVDICRFRYGFLGGIRLAALVHPSVRRSSSAHRPPCPVRIDASSGDAGQCTRAAGSRHNSDGNGQEENARRATAQNAHQREDQKGRVLQD